MHSSLSLRQGRRLSAKKDDLHRQAGPEYPRSVPRSPANSQLLPTHGSEKRPGGESTYDWLSRQYLNFFGTTTEREREGMTSAYAFEGVEPGVGAANKRMEAEMQNTLQAEGANITQYVKADKELSTGANLYVNTTESSMDYRGMFVRDGEGIAYVTDRGALKSVGPASGAVYKSIIGQRGCPGRVEKTTVSSQDNGNGTVGNDPYFFKGTPMGLNEPCGSAGINSQVIGASMPANNTRTWEGKCLEGVNDRFLAQEDIVGKTAKTAFNQCHARAADIGASSFYVRKENQHKFPCFVSPPSKTFDDVIAGGTDATVEVRSSRWIAEKSVAGTGSDNEAAGILNDGTIVIGSVTDSNEDDFAAAVDMLTTQNTMLTSEAQGVKQQGCDPIEGASIRVQSATFGNNCGGMPLTPATETFSEEPVRELPPTPPPSPIPEPAAPEPDPMEYWQVPKGGGACPATNAITSMDECKAAAEAQGLVFAGGAGEHPDHIDCFQVRNYFAENNLAVSWAKTSASDRATPGGYFKANYSALCQKPFGEESEREQVQKICDAENPDWTVRATNVSCAADACNTRLGEDGWMDLCNAGRSEWSCCAKDFVPPTDPAPPAPKSYTCVPGQGETGAVFTHGVVNEFAQCSHACTQYDQCKGFDFTTTNLPDNCRLYGDNTPRTDPGSDSRQYCTK